MANIQIKPNRGRAIVNKSIPQKIYIRYILGRKVDFEASIRLEVLINDWDFTKQRFKKRTHIPHLEYNNLIQNLINHFSEYENKNIENGIIPTYQDVKNHFDSFFKEDINESKTTLSRFIEQFIEDAKTKPNVNTNRIVSYNTLKDYKLTYNTLVEFNKVRKFDFETIDLDWYYDFIDWCNKKGFKLNYTGKHIKTLKTFLNSAFDKDLTKNVSYKSKKFKVLNEETDSVYLDNQELLKLWSLDLTNNPTQDKVRDLFLIGAFTGLRVSDFNNLNNQNIIIESNIKMLKVKTGKTGKVVVIPLHPIVEQILIKRVKKNDLKISTKTINQEIKKICKQLEFNDIVSLRFNRGGKDIVINQVKHELISSHTARRSFCSNAYLSGMEKMDIMAISGHTTEKNFKKYIKVALEQIAIKMSEHPFFKDASALKVV